MTPEELRREQRTDALVAFIGLACLLLAFVGGSWGLLLWTVG